MTPELALTELRSALELTLTVGAPMLLAVLAVGVIVGLVQAATQIQEPTVGFVAKVLALAGVLAGGGAWMLTQLTDFTTTLIQRIPQIVGG